MFLKRFYDAPLAQASYLIGCQRTGEAIVVDPNRDVEPYVAAATAEGLRITLVTETHIHADFVSGARELAERTGARLLLSAEGGADWQYAYAPLVGARLLRDGDVVMVGNVRLDVMHTPGHTPEHLAFVVTDTANAAQPMGILTGDFVFVGDVGRPDLLERAAGHVGTMETGARTLFRSLERFRALPDWLQVWPGHGAGSACGKSLGAVPTSTVGYEKLANWGVATKDEATFVEMVLAGQPEPPVYFAQMKRINRDGPRVLGRFPRPERMPDEPLGALVADGAFVVDMRPSAAFAAGHVPGTLTIPLNGSFSKWAGWLLPYDRDVYLMADVSGAEASVRVEAAARELAMIGLDRVAGWFEASAVSAWAAANGAPATVAQISVQELGPRLARGEVAVVDVRGREEWEAGHIPGTPNIPVGHLTDRLAELPTDRPLVLQCQRGSRSMIAAALLQARGFTNVVNLVGGYVGWQAAGGAVERGEAAMAEAPK